MGNEGSGGGGGNRTRVPGKPSVDATSADTGTSSEQPVMSPEQLGVLLGGSSADRAGLVEVVQAWSDLPHPLRASILAMIRAAREAD